MNFDVAFLIPLAAFWLLMGATAVSPEARARLKAKPWRDWLIDLLGLGVQGWLVPLLQISLVWTLLHAVKPTGRGVWAIEGWQALVLNLVVVDYAYYWNHRLLHARWWWPLHRVHHTLTAQDVLGTSRNTLYASLFILYLWVNGALLYFLTDPMWFGLGVAITAALDLWRHSSWGPAAGTAAHRGLSLVLVTPADHGWHHSRDRFGINFGANFSWWDRLHGTWLPAAQAGETAPALGVDDGLPLWRRLFWPFTARDFSAGGRS